MLTQWRWQRGGGGNVISAPIFAALRYHELRNPTSPPPPPPLHVAHSCWPNHFHTGGPSPPHQRSHSLCSVRNYFPICARDKDRSKKSGGGGGVHRGVTPPGSRGAEVGEVWFIAFFFQRRKPFKFSTSEQISQRYFGKTSQVGSP